MSSARFSSCEDEERRHREILAVLDRGALALETMARAMSRATEDPRDVLRAAEVARKQRAAAEDAASDTTEPGPTGRKKDRTP